MDSNTKQPLPFGTLGMQTRQITSVGNFHCAGAEYSNTEQLRMDPSQWSRLSCILNCWSLFLLCSCWLFILCLCCWSLFLLWTSWFGLSTGSCAVSDLILGIHKKKAFSDATVCLYIFDILYLNGETLLDTPMKQRRKILKEHIKVRNFWNRKCAVYNTNKEKFFVECRWRCENTKHLDEILTRDV